MTVRVRVPYLRWRRCLWEPYSQSRCCYGCKETANKVACCSLLRHDLFVTAFFSLFFFKGFVHPSNTDAGLDLSKIVSF